MGIPENLKYSKDHEWVKIEGNEALIGITDYAQDQLGDIVYVDITASEGDDIPAGYTFGSIEAVKTVSDLFMPISGKLLEINPMLDGEPELINTDPYGEGWIIRVELQEDSEMGDLLDAAAYQDFTE